MDIISEFEELSNRTNGKGKCVELDYLCSRICSDVGELLNQYVLSKYHTNHPYVIKRIGLKDHIGDFFYNISQLTHNHNGLRLDSLILEASQISNMIFGFNTKSLTEYELVKLLYRVGLSLMDEVYYRSKSVLNLTTRSPSSSLNNILISFIKVLLILINKEELDLKNILELNINKLTNVAPHLYTDYTSQNRKSREELENF
jgi:hypothetical protein